MRQGPLQRIIQTQTVIERLCDEKFGSKLTWHCGSLMIIIIIIIEWQQ